MPERNNYENIQSHFSTNYYHGDTHHIKFPMVTRAVKGGHSVTSTMRNIIIWPHETNKIAESTTVEEFLPSLPAIVTEKTMVTEISTNLTSGFTDATQGSMVDIVNTTINTVTAGIQDTIDLTGTVMSVTTDAAQDVAVNNSVNGILNNTVMSTTQEAMVDAVNNNVNVINDISNPTTLTNMIGNAVTSIVNSVETTPPAIADNVDNMANEVQTTFEHTSATIANAVKNGTTLITDAVSTTAKNIGCEYLHENEHEGFQKGTNAVLVLILLVLIFIGLFLVYIYLRHKKMKAIQADYQVNHQQEETATTELQHEQKIEIGNDETYVQHTMT